MKTCKKCNNENPDVLRWCKYCGAMLELTAEQEQEDLISKNNRRRNGFVTFWLILLMIVNGFMGSLNFAPEQAFGSNYDILPMWYYGISCIVSYATVVACILLLLWKKSGFIMIVSIAGISFLLNIIIGNISILSIAGPVVSTTILYYVLQIRRRGVSCWDHLS